MKTIFFYVFLFSWASYFFLACEDPYSYNDKEPSRDLLGESIYDYLEQNGHFTYYLRIVDSVQDAGTSYAEVLRRTGTKTVFVANDSAYEAFFANNSYGIHSFNDFTVAQKRAILFSGMLDDAYLMEMLGSTPGISGSSPNKGQALRRFTSWQVLDNVQFETGDQLPNTPLWAPYKNSGMYLLSDNSQWTMVHFIEAEMLTQNITPEDFTYITKTMDNPAGMQWNMNDAYIFSSKIIQKDITCKNGYINVLDRFQMPPDNMGESMRKGSDTKLFNHFFERYCAPYYDQTNTMNYRKINPDFIDKNLYVKRFFTASNIYYPDANGNPDPNREVPAMLKFDPQNNFATSPIQSDMAVIFVPTDDALNQYFSDAGSGKILKERYGYWDSIPDDVMSVFLNNHMWNSFLLTTPSRFETIQNQMGIPLGIKPEDVVYTTICSNGVIYHVNKVYTPSDYSSVMAPVIFGANTKIMYWAVKNLSFDLYLLSIENKFSFIVPTDDVFNNYIYPISVGQSSPERWKFFFTASNTVQAIRYNMTGDSIGVVTNQAIISNVLLDIVDNHIVVGDIEDGKTYYQTKGGATVKVTGSGVGMTLDEGGNSEQNETVDVVSIYNQENGKTYLTDKIVQTPTQSVYSTLSSHDEFSEFFALCRDVHPITTIDKITYGGYVFVNLASNIGITPNVSFFNTYNYTVYVPTNAAMEKAHDAGRYKTPDEIDQLDVEQQGPAMQELYEFLRYHFQDNSVYIGGNSYSNVWFETATMNNDTEKFRKVYVTNDANSLSVLTENGTTAHVITNGGLYNFMTRDYLFNTGLINSSTQIATSSFAVIHQIDAVLDFK